MNYWHWMFDCVLKLIVLNSIAGLSYNDMEILICGSSTLKSFQWDILSLLGINRFQVKIIPNRIDLHECWVVCLPSPISHSYEMVQLLSQTILQKASINGLSNLQSHKRLFIERGSALNSRNIKNIDNVRDRALAYGYVSIDPGKLSIYDQISAFMGADFIFGTHGLCFSKYDFMVLNFKFVNYFFQIIALFMNML